MSGYAEVITKIDRLAAIAPAWRELWSRVPNTTPFQSPDWLLPWWDIFAPGELRVIAIWHAGDLVGVAPLYRDSQPVPRLLPLGVSLSDYMDLTFDSTHFGVAARTFCAALDEMSDIGECEFPEIRANGQTLHIEPVADWYADDSPGSVCPLLVLPEDTSELGEHIPPSRLRHLRTARRRAARRGKTTIVVGDADNSAALLTELVRLELLRWSGGVFSDPRVAEFHAAALPGLMERGLARMYALEIGTRIVGVWYGFSHRSITYAYLCVFDPDFRFESPGAILIGYSIDEAVREGAHTFDFLRGRETYKYEWGARDRVNTRRVFRRRSQ